MPYINSQERVNIEKVIKQLQINHIGQLNYIISRLCDDYLKNSGTSYATLNAIIGVLSCVQLEFYRRIVSPYEDIKCSQNGDVFTSLGFPTKKS